MLSKYVDKVMVGFEESRKHYPHPERVTVTGTPVRGDFSFRTRRKPGQSWGFPMKSLWWSPFSWGSLGALVMNQHMVDFVVRECREGQPFHHIYGVGKRYYERVRQALADRGLIWSNTLAWMCGSTSTICRWFCPRRT